MGGVFGRYVQSERLWWAFGFFADIAPDGNLYLPYLSGQRRIELMRVSHRLETFAVKRHAPMGWELLVGRAYLRTEERFGS